MWRKKGSSYNRYLIHGNARVFSCFARNTDEIFPPAGNQSLEENEKRDWNIKDFDLFIRSNIVIYTFCAYLAFCSLGKVKNVSSAKMHSRCKTWCRAVFQGQRH